MEIITYIVSGALQHRDSMGSGSVIRRGDVQVMSAGQGIRHSEFNASADEPVHLLQIWILPEKNGVAPRYGEKTFAEADKRNRLQLLVSGDGRDGSLMIHQQASLYASVLEAGSTLEHPLEKGRAAWVQVVAGRGIVNGIAVAAGDGVAVLEENVSIKAETQDSEVLIFDLPARAS
jgi:hypothetical protein